MQAPRDESTFTVWPVRVTDDAAAKNARWSVYLIRVDLQRFQAPSALKIGMVGTSTVKQRLARHQSQFGKPTPSRCGRSRTRSAPSIQTTPGGSSSSTRHASSSRPSSPLPSARLRRLRPDTLVYSYEWFEDDPIVIEAVEGSALLPVTLPHGWTLADTTEPTERSEEAPLQGNGDPFPPAQC